MKSRIRQIIEFLNQKEDGTKWNEAANRLEVSEKTIRDEVLSYQMSPLQKSVSLEQEKGKLYLKKNRTFTRSEWQAWLDQLDGHENESDDRIQYILRQLVLSDDYIKLEDLADQMGISPATFHRDFKNVKKQLERNHLSVTSKPGHGLKVEGSELAKRIVFAHALSKSQTNNLNRFCDEMGFDSEDYFRIQYDLQKVLNAHGLFLTEIGLRNLVIHILCALDRISHHKYLENKGIEYEITCAEKEAATELIWMLENEYKVQFPESEARYIELHFLSKRANDGTATVMISQKTEQILYEGFQKLHDELGTDFSKDLELMTTLAKHIEPMLSRMEYGLSIPNPLLDQVRALYPGAYDCAVVFADLVQEKYGLKTNDDELGYLSLHFHLALSRAQRKKPWNVLVVCTSGYGSAVFLKQKLKNQYELEDKNIRLTRIDEIDVLQSNAYDFIFTNVPLICTTNTPVIQLEDLLSPLPKRLDDLKNSVWNLLKPELAFFLRSFAKKEDVLDFLCRQATGIYDLPPDFRELVYKRERLSATEIGSYVAIPHPYAMCTNQTIMCLCTLKKAILWNKRKVKFVFLISYAKKDLTVSHMYNEQLMERLLDADWTGKLEKCTNYEQFKNLIEL